MRLAPPFASTSSRQVTARRRVVAAIIAPVAGIVASVALLGVFAIVQGTPVAESLEGAVLLAFLATVVGAPFAYGTEALLLLACGTIPPGGARGVILSAAIGGVAGSLVLPLLVSVTTIRVAPGGGWLVTGALGAVIGATAGAVYTLIVSGRTTSARTAGEAERVLQRHRR